MEHSPPAPALFVATDLDHFETNDEQLYAADVTICGRAYRRLDPPYYAWLRRQTASAKRALDTGRLSASAFDAVRTAFNAVHAWAVRAFGEAALVAAAKAFEQSKYEPPRPDDDLSGCGARRPPTSPRNPSGFVCPATCTLPFIESVTADAVAKVNAIRDEAMSLGWSEDALLKNRGWLRFPYGREYGLVCFVDGDAVIAEVTREAIAIRHPRGAAHRLFNPDVEQPWRRPALACGGDA